MDNRTQPDHVVDESASVAAYQHGWNDAARGEPCTTDARAPIAYGLGYFDAVRKTSGSN